MAEGDAIIDFNDLFKGDEAFENAIDNVNELKKELEDLVRVFKKANSALSPSDTMGIANMEKEVKKLETAKKNLAKQEKILSNAKKKDIELTSKQLIAIQEAKLAQREKIALAKQEAIINKAAAGSIASLRAQLSKNTIEWKNLSAAERDNSNKGKGLVKTKLALTNQLKKLEKQTGDTRRNVGNYTDSLGKLGKTAARVFIGRSIVDGLRRVAMVTGQLIEQNKGADAGIAKLDKSLNRFARSGSSLASKLLSALAPALVFVTDKLADLLDFFTGTDSRIKEFSATSDELKGTIDSLNEEMTKEVSTLNQVFSALGSTTEGSKERKAVIDQINTQYGQYLPNLLTEKSSLEDIAIAQGLVNDALTKTFLLRIQQATQTDIFINKTNAQTDAFKRLQDRATKAGKSISSEFTFAFSQLVENFNDATGAGKDARDIINGVTNSFGPAGDRLAEINPKLLELVRQLKVLGGSGDTVAFIESIVSETAQYNDAIGETNLAIGALNEGLTTYDRNLESNTNATNANSDAQRKNTQARIDAINELQRQLAETEAGNIKDREQMALRLEELRFEAENAQRIANFKELETLLEGQAEQLEQAEQLNFNLSEEQLKKHLDNKLKIRKDNAIETINIEAIDVTQGGESEQVALLNEEVKLVEDANKKKEESNKELLKSVSENAQKVSEIITDLFEKQADLSKAAVDEQVSNLDAARERVANGYEANLAFEEEQLAKRQAEAQRREKEAAQAQRIAALFNLVSAYAQSGDDNALQNGLRDWALLTTLAGALGFEEGGYTGDNATDAISGVVHGQEFVVTAADTARYNLKGKKGSDFGEAMSDYYAAKSPTTQNLYAKQREAFERGVAKSDNGESSKEVVNAINDLSKQIKSQPNVDYKIKKVIEGVYWLVAEENKANMKKITKELLKARKNG